MSTLPRFVGFWTPGPYAGDWCLLRESLEALEIEHDFRQVPSGSWQRVTQFKAEVVREALEKADRKGIVYVDVDAVVLKRPALFEGMGRRCDVAAAVWPGGELLSGTVFFAQTVAARQVVEQWIRNNLAFPERLPDGREAWDQRTLKMALKQAGRLARFEELPPEYTWMVGMSQKRFGDRDAVILHTRGSLRHNPEHV